MLSQWSVGQRLTSTRPVGSHMSQIIPFLSSIHNISVISCFYWSASSGPVVHAIHFLLISQKTNTFSGQRTRPKWMSYVPLNANRFALTSRVDNKCRNQIYVSGCQSRVTNQSSAQTYSELCLTHRIYSVMLLLC